MPKKYERGFKNSGIKTYQILTNNDEVCIPSLFSILLAVRHSIIELVHNQAFMQTFYD